MLELWQRTWGWVEEKVFQERASPDFRVCLDVDSEKERFLKLLYAYMASI